MLQLELVIQSAQILLVDVLAIIRHFVYLYVAVVADGAQILLNIQIYFDVLEDAEFGHLYESTEAVWTEEAALPELRIFSPLIIGKSYQYELIIEAIMNKIADVSALLTTFFILFALIIITSIVVAEAS